MFRDTKGSEMSIKQFGVGSTISGEGSDRYLIIGRTDHSGVVGLLNLQTMKRVGKEVSVEDVNCLSSAEARALSNEVGLPWTFSDFDCDAQGLKFVCDNKKFWINGRQDGMKK